MFEQGPGRGQLQYLASLFHPDGPNDLAPVAYNMRSPEADPPRSPLPRAAPRDRLPLGHLRHAPQHPRAKHRRRLSRPAGGGEARSFADDAQLQPDYSTNTGVPGVVAGQP